MSTKSGSISAWNSLMIAVGSASSHDGAAAPASSTGRQPQSGAPRLYRSSAADTGSVSALTRPCGASRSVPVAAVPSPGRPTISIAVQPLSSATELPTANTPVTVVPAGSLTPRISGALRCTVVAPAASGFMSTIGAASGMPLTPTAIPPGPPLTWTSTSGYAASRSSVGALPNSIGVNVIGAGAGVPALRTRAHTVNGVRG